MPFLLALVRLACPALVLIVMSACSAQGEGQQCNKKATGNGSSDCADGLTCTSSSIIVPIPGESYGVCCKAGSTNPACLTSETTAANPNPMFDAAAESPADAAAESEPESAPFADAPADVAPEGAGLGPDAAASMEASTEDAQGEGDGAAQAQGSADSTVE